MDNGTGGGWVVEGRSWRGAAARVAELRTPPIYTRNVVWYPRFHLPSRVSSRSPPVPLGSAEEHSIISDCRRWHRLELERHEELVDAGAEGEDRPVLRDRELPIFIR